METTQDQQIAKARLQFVDPYVADLRSQIGLYIGYIPNTYADSPSSENFYEVLKNDAAVSHAMHLLSIMAAGERVEVVSQKTMAKKVVDLAFRYIRDFTHCRKSLIYGGVLFGLSLQQKFWEKVRWPEFPGMVWEVPTELREIDRRRLRIERDSEDRNKLYWTLYKPELDEYIILEDKGINPDAEFSIQDYIWYMHEYEELNPYGRGFGDVLYSLAYIKSKVIQYWADLCECWAKPFMVAIIDAAKAAVNANLGSGFVSQAKRANDLIDAFEKARARHMVVIDKSDQVDFHEAGSTGNNILGDLLAYCDSKIQLLILGAELTTSAPSVGSYALGQIHRGATQSIIQYNRLRLEEVLERDLLQCFFIRNKKNFIDLGLRFRPGDIKLKIRVQSEEEAKAQAKKGQDPFGGMS